MVVLVLINFHRPDYAIDQMKTDHQDLANHLNLGALQIRTSWILELYHLITSSIHNMLIQRDAKSDNPEIEPLKLTTA